ncbi:MAG TPA: hypothetical protein VIL86_20750 [Tepidisphaeraceae bacterium]
MDSILLETRAATIVLLCLFGTGCHYTTHEDVTQRYRGMPGMMLGQSYTLNRDMALVTGGEGHKRYSIVTPTSVEPPLRAVGTVTRGTTIRFERLEELFRHDGIFVIPGFHRSYGRIQTGPYSGKLVITGSGQPDLNQYYGIDRAFISPSDEPANR